MIDLDAIEARSAASVEADGTRDGRATLSATADDVPALVAEVRRLRRVLASLICLPCRGEGRINNGETCATCLGTGTYEQLGYVRE